MVGKHDCASKKWGEEVDGNRGIDRVKIFHVVGVTKIVGLNNFMSQRLHHKSRQYRIISKVILKLARYTQALPIDIYIQAK
jgi:hypothetical protein